MTRSQRMRRIVTLADAARDGAALKVGDSRRARDAERARLEQFRGYREEYQRTLCSGTMSAVQARELRAFIAQIDRTIELLEQRAGQAEQRYGEDVGAWKRESRRARSLDEVAVRAARAEAHGAEGALQREIDERSGRPREQGD